jgi:hypothetical protein
LARWSSAYTHSGIRLSCASVVGGTPSKGSGSGGDSSPFPHLSPLKSAPRARSCNFPARGTPRAAVYRPGTFDTPTSAQRRSSHERDQRMIRVAVEIREGATSLRETVSADSVRQAVSVMRERYPGRDVRVVFPIDSEEFFVGGPKTGAGPDESRQPRPLHAPSAKI